MLASHQRLDAVHLGAVRFGAVRFGAVRLGAVDQRLTAASGHAVDVE